MSKGMLRRKPRRLSEQARLLIEQAEALGEPPEDPLLLFSVLYGFWVANYVAFNGDVMRELAAQFLALAEKQGATVPLMIGHRLMGISLLCTGDIAARPSALRSARSRFTILPSIVRWRRDLAKTFGWQSCPIGRGPCGCLAIPRPRSQTQTKRSSDAREIGQAATLMYALVHASLTHIYCGNYAAANALVDELVALADEKGALFWKALGMMQQGCVLALTGKASDAVHMITSGITACRSTGATSLMPLYLSYLARAYAELGQFDDAWRCIGEAMTAVETTKERWWEAEVNRMAGEIALHVAASRMRRKRKRISSVRSRLRASSRQSPGNCARR